jgi:hypothetical protein
VRLNFNQNPNEDITALLAFIEGMSSNDRQVSTSINTSKVRSIIAGVRQDFPHKDGIDNASIFKKAANLMLYFIAEKPIESEEIGNLKIPPEIQKFQNHLNTIVAFNLACALLHNASILQKNGPEKILANRIKLSKHSLIDIIESLCTATPATHFYIVTVLLEQLAYKTNLDCQYDTFEI